jgi:hypothetical protein
MAVVMRMLGTVGYKSTTTTTATTTTTSVKSQLAPYVDFDDNKSPATANPSNDMKSNANSRLYHCYDHYEYNPRQPCDSLIVSNQTIDFKLRWVGRCLTQLVLDEDQDLRDDDVIVSRRGSMNTERKDVVLRNSNRDHIKLKAMMKIYTLLLKQVPSPIPFLTMAKQSSSCCGSYQQISLLDARQQVLCLIERLGGYCDSIDLLRCILRSDHMIGVIYAFDAIIKNFNGAKYHYMGEINRSRSVAKEFWIIQEWKF